MISIISLKKFNLGGHPMLKEQNKNHSRHREGINVIIPFVIKNLRVESRSYEIFASIKSPDEQIPCPIIIKYDPVNPSLNIDTNPMIHIHICAIDE